MGPIMGATAELWCDARCRSAAPGLTGVWHRIYRGSTWGEAGTYGGASKRPGSIAKACAMRASVSRGTLTIARSMR